MRLRKLLAAREGFTLTELLIVIAIIGVLTGVAVLGYSTFTGGADDAVAEANARICATADALIATPGFDEAALADLFPVDGQTYESVCGP